MYGKERDMSNPSDHSNGNGGDDQGEESSSAIRQILERTRTIAVVGLSDDWSRPSNFAAKYMQEHGYTIVPINPRYEIVLGEKCYRSLDDLEEPVDMVDCFRPPEFLPQILDGAIRLKVRYFWAQIGIVHKGVAERASEAGMSVVMDRCVKIEHARLFGGLNFVGVNTGVISSRRSRIIHN
jgi:predicted CoA-binding protein